MSRETGPSCKQCRASGMKLFLKGERCYNDEKCGVKRRPFPPGQHGGQRGGRRRKNVTEYAIQLREKQRARRMFGVTESQFSGYNAAAVQQKGVTGELMFQMLERRLDNVVYRLGLASSRKQARQLIRHRHILVNKKLVDIPSYLVKTDELIEVKERSKKVQAIRDSANSASQRLRVPGWLESNPLELRGTVLEMPVKEKMGLEFEDHLIVEYYSR